MMAVNSICCNRLKAMNLANWLFNQSLIFCNNVWLGPNFKWSGLFPTIQISSVSSSWIVVMAGSLGFFVIDSSRLILGSLINRLSFFFFLIISRTVSVSGGIFFQQ